MNLTDFGPDGFTLADVLLVTAVVGALVGGTAKVGRAVYRMGKAFYRIEAAVDQINASVNHVADDEDPETVGKGVRVLLKELREEQRADYQLLLARLDSHIQNHKYL